jgi:hypothetical protein
VGGGLLTLNGVDEGGALPVGLEQVDLNLPDQPGEPHNTITAQLEAIPTGVELNVEAGTLAVMNTDNTFTASSTFNVAANAELTGGVSDTGLALDEAAVTLTDSTVKLDSTLVLNSTPNALGHFGYHINNDNLAMNLDGNAGMFNGGSPESFQNFQGETTLTTGPGNRGLDFNNDGDFTATGVIAQADNYSNLFVGTLHVSGANAGVWQFREETGDDPTGFWIDLDQDGVFESSAAGLGSDRGEQVIYNAGGFRQVTLAEGAYLVAFTHREGGGGSQIDYNFTAPNITERTVNPSDPVQDGLWSFDRTLAGLVAAAGVSVVAPNTTVTANGSSTILLGADVNGAQFGRLQTAASATVNVDGGGVAFGSSALGGDSNNANTVNALNGIVVNLGQVSGTPNLNINSAGDGTVRMESGTGPFTANNTITVADGRLMVGAGETTTALGLADVVVDGAVLEFELVGAWSTTEEIPNALRHYGFTRGAGAEDQGQMDLFDGPGSMFNGGNPTAHPRFVGESLFTDGPAGRGLNFDSDADFINAVGVPGDNYTNLWLGTLHVSSDPNDSNRAGDWEFRYSDIDDWRGMWLDRDQDGVFESNGNLNSNQNEQLAWQDGGTKTVNLAAGDYLVGFTHLEGGGGSRAEVQVKSPGMAGQAVIKPSDAAQAGFWGAPVFNISTISNDISLRNDPIVDLGNLGGLTVDGGNFVTDASTMTVQSQDAALKLTGGGHDLAAGVTLSPDPDTRIVLDQPATSAPDVIIANGAVAVSNAAAFNGAGATVATGGQLQLEGDITFSDDVEIGGSGYDGIGALVNYDGDNTYDGNLSFSGAVAAIGAQAGELTIETDLDITGTQLSFNGGGDVTVNGVISGTTGLNTVFNQINYGFYDGASNANLAAIDDGTDNNATNGGVFSLTPSPQSAWPGAVQAPPVKVIASQKRQSSRTPV